MAKELPLLGIEGDVSNLLIPFGTGIDNDGTFSFRRQTEKSGSINICPSSMRDAIRGYLDKDTAMQQVQYKKEESKKDRVGNTMFQNILNNIPAVQIREYAQDARVVQVMNCAKALKAGWDAFKDVKVGDSLWDAFEWFIKLVPEKIKQAFAELHGWSYAVNDNRFPRMDNEYRSFVLNAPFIMYYQLMSSKTTGYYTLPYSGKLVDSSNGQTGWNQQHGFNGVDTSNNSFLGTVLNFLGKNIKFNTTPTWEGNTSADFPQIEIQFDLFNDSMQSALNNFVFLHNIVPKNRFIQYHIFQHNPCVYDMKIEGYGRFYMCSGNITCDYKGVSRRPPSEFFKALYGKLAPRWKDVQDRTDAMWMEAERIIRIPDVYSFKISLQSLLPNSLNNYLYQFSGNADMEDKGISGSEVGQVGAEYMRTDIQNAVDDAVTGAATKSGLKKIVENMEKEKKA